MQQIYQQQMEAQANHTLNNEEKNSSSGHLEIPELANLNLEGSYLNTDHLDLGSGFDPDSVSEEGAREEGEEEEHQCSEECGFCSDEERKFEDTL
jgi:hypothetical protein